jgi:hypothetical protein
LGLRFDPCPIRPAAPGPPARSRLPTGDAGTRGVETASRYRLQ